MPVRSKRVAGPVNIGTSAATVYTVPAGETFRGMAWLACEHTSASELTVRVNGTPAWIGILSGRGVTAMNPIILNPGDVLSAICTAGTWKVTLWGSELEGFAD